MAQVIIPCSDKKKDAAPTLCLNGRPISFVANPAAPDQRRPWDPIAPGNPRTWIHCVADYNWMGHLNPIDTSVKVTICGGLDLWCAGTLYDRLDYSAIIELIGFDNVFILSAGWGLIRADFRIPPYDVTFSSGIKVKGHAKIKPHDRAIQPKLVDNPPGMPLRVFVYKQYFPFINQILPLPAASIEPCNGRVRSWVFKPAKNWIRGFVMPPAPRNGPCPCRCGFALPNMNCGQQPGRVVPVV